VVAGKLMDRGLSVEVSSPDQTHLLVRSRFHY
jgi:hypothetical protein